MKRAWVNYYIDIGLALVFLMCAVTGIVKMPGLNKLLGFSYSSMPMRTLSFIHDWSGIIMVVLVGIHLALHWKWITAMTKQAYKKRKRKKKGKK